MDFHEIDTKGKLWIQRVASKPTWTSGDVGRVIYVTSENAFYFATSASWLLWGSDIIPAGTKMVFYQNTAPTGWTIDGTVADSLIGVKGGTSDYNINAGNSAGSWTQDNHTHTFSDSFSVSHNHSVTHLHAVSILSQTELNDGENRAYDQGGDDTHRHWVIGNTANFTGSTGNTAVADTISGTTSSNATAATWRPYAAICIVATKD